jgi:hypothetical protein
MMASRLAVGHASLAEKLGVPLHLFDDGVSSPCLTMSHPCVEVAVDEHGLEPTLLRSL